MRVSDLLGALEVRQVLGDPDVEVTVAAHDSRSVTAGTLFCCVPGAHHDGHDHAAEAVARGARALLVDHPLDLEVTQVVVPDVRPAMAVVAARLAGDPSSDLAVVGITGTNGKTTTTHLVAAIAEAAGRRAAVIGTLSGLRTTPEATELQPLLAAERDAGTSMVAMELSSHALAQHRADALHVAVAVFTNLSVDHLDFHRTLEEYFEAKASLFAPGRCDRAVVVVDDEWGRRLHERVLAAGIPCVAVSAADVDDLHVGPDGSRFRWRGHDVVVPLPGRFNVVNALCAAEAARALGIDDDAVVAGLAAAPAVPGRMERVVAGQPFEVLVDYAHTPDALARLLAAADELTAGGRVHLLFGAGGDRDRSKRPLMGAAAARGADRVVLTADNSRGEDTAAILAALRDGVGSVDDPRAAEVVVEPDRARAIELVLGGARRGDVVVLAGKGHETTQTIGATTLPFDDRAVARAVLERGGSAR